MFRVEGRRVKAKDVRAMHAERDPREREDFAAGQLELARTGQGIHCSLEAFTMSVDMGKKKKLEAAAPGKACRRADCLRVARARFSVIRSHECNTAAALQRSGHKLCSFHAQAEGMTLETVPPWSLASHARWPSLARRNCSSDSQATEDGQERERS